MNHIENATAAWSDWVRRTAPDVLDAITNVQLNDEGHGGYDIHLSAWNADQLVVDSLASALGCPTNEGWKPKGNGVTERMWSLDVKRAGLSWHVTAIQPIPVWGGGATGFVEHTHPADKPATRVPGCPKCEVLNELER